MDDNWNTEVIWRLVDAKQSIFVDLSDRIWQIPEPNVQQTRSARAHAATAKTTTDTAVEILLERAKVDHRVPLAITP